MAEKEPMGAGKNAELNRHDMNIAFLPSGACRGYIMRWSVAVIFVVFCTHETAFYTFRVWLVNLTGLYFKHLCVRCQFLIEINYLPVAYN